MSEKGFKFCGNGQFVKGLDLIRIAVFIFVFCFFFRVLLSVWDFEICWFGWEIHLVFFGGNYDMCISTMNAVTLISPCKMSSN